VDVARLVTAYYSEHPDPSVPEQRVSFGTSGHRGSSLRASFNDDHIAVTTQAICDYRRGAGIDGPLFLARDTHALSEPAWVTAVEVLAANEVTVLVDSRDGYTPTPALSHAVLAHNRAPGRNGGEADGIVVTPSHNPPSDGGFKYNPPDGGPAGTEVTGVVQDRANALLAAGLREVRRIPIARARAAATTGTYDFLDAYVSDLPSAIDLGAIAAAGARIGADPLGGASVAYWGVIGERYGLDLTVVNPEVDPTWRFMTLDWDGKIRMDCSSPYAMASLIKRRQEFQVATGNDADADRHGVVTPDGGLMNPNHFLSAAIEYLFAYRPGWPAEASVGKTLVSSSMIDRVAAGLGRRLVLPAPRRLGVDDRQGRDPVMPARLRDPGRDGELAERALPGPRRSFRQPFLRAGRRPRQPGGKGGARRIAPRGRDRHRTGRRADHGEADHRPRQRRSDRRVEGGDGVRLVRGPAFGDRGRVQDLCRVFPGTGPSGSHPGRGEGSRRQCPARCVAARGRVTARRPDAGDSGPG
jgi:phosphomannomutase